MTVNGTLWRLVPQEDHAAVKAAMHHAFDPSGDGAYDIEHRITRPDGRYQMAAYFRMCRICRRRRRAAQRSYFAVPPQT